MFLREFTEPDPILIKLVGITSQLKSDIDGGKIPPEWTVDELLSYFNENGIVLGKDTLYDAIKQPPMNKFIKNIQGDKVIFKGQQEEMTPSPDENQKVVQQMAKSAMK